jgi:hypothetical protein
MNRVFTFLVLMTFVIGARNIYGQCDWYIEQFGGSSTDELYDLAIDNSDNIYITGGFVGTVSFGSTTLNSNGDKDIYIVKMNSAGEVQWATGFGGSFEDYGVAIEVDNSGGVYVTGMFHGTVNFSGLNKTSEGSKDVFLLKVSSGGALQWIETVGGDNGDDVVGLGLSGSTLFIAGTQSSATFGGSVTMSGSGSYVAKYSTAGALQGVESATASGSLYPQALIADGNGDFVVCGSYYSITLGTSSFTSVGGSDAIIIKYNGSDLSYNWARTGGGSSSDEALRLAVDNSNNIYCAGEFDGSAFFEGNNLTSYGDQDVFLVKYNSSGTLQFATSGGSPSCCENPQGLAIDDNNGLIYMAAYFQGNATFGGQSIDYAYNSILKFSTSGITQEFLELPSGSTSSYGLGRAVQVGSAGQIFIGVSSYGFYFGNDYYNSNNGSDDIFVYKLDALTNLLIPEDPFLCMVSIDDNSGKYEVIWDSDQDAAVNVYHLMKENILGEYEEIYSENAGGSGSYIDLNSEPRERAASYALIAEDFCGALPDPDDVYGDATTMHLIMYEGPNTTWSLHWSDYELDREYDDDEDALLYYRILRGTSEDNLTPYDSIQKWLTNTWTDLDPPVGAVFYKVEAVLDQDCAIGKKANSNRVSSIDFNTGDLSGDQIDGVITFPNPCESYIQIMSENDLIQQASVDLISSTGVLLKTWQKELGSEQTLDVQDFEPGTYTLRVYSDGVIPVYKTFTKL